MKYSLSALLVIVHSFSFLFSKEIFAKDDPSINLDLPATTSFSDNHRHRGNIQLSPIEEKRSTLKTILESKYFSEGIHTKLLAKDLWMNIVKQNDKIHKGVDMKSTIQTILTPETYISVVTNVGKDDILGFIQLDFKQKEIIINFGPKFGSDKIQLSEKSFHGLSEPLSLLRNTLELSSNDSIYTQMDFISSFDSERDRVQYTGDILHITDSGEDKHIINSFYDKDLIAYNVFMLLLKSILNLHHKDAGMIPYEKYQSKIDAFNRITQDATKIDGVFTFYKNKDQLYLLVDKNKLGRIWCARSTVSIGSIAPYETGGSNVYNTITPYVFEKSNQKIYIKHARANYKWSDDGEIAESAKNAYKEPILFKMPIIAERPDLNQYLVDFKPFMEKYFTGKGHLGDDSYGIPRSEDVQILDVKSFPKNAVIRFGSQFKNYSSSSNDKLGNHGEVDREHPVEMIANLWYRKDTGYKPRLYDTRVGYFTTDIFNLDRIEKAKVREEYINRWNLKKKNPSQELSEPIKPIVWTIDHSVPKKYRVLVREGILEWNKAFEQIGFKNAIIVQDPPKDKNYHHADARFNVVRWLVGGVSYGGRASWLCDPFTGEILSSYFNLDASLVRKLKYGYGDYLYYGASSDAIIRKPSNKTSITIHPCNDCSSKTKLRENSGYQEQCNIISTCLNSWPGLNKKEVKKEIVRQWLKQGIMHEMGHCLGLRHNFISPAFLTTDELKDESIISKLGVSSSVMDYASINLYALQKGKGTFYSQTIGVYDYHAIEYGYKPIVSTNIQTEKKILEELVAKKSGDPAYQFMTDEDCYFSGGKLPYVTVFALAKDGVQFNKDFHEFMNKVRKNIIHNFVVEGKDFAKQTRYLFNTFFSQHQYAKLTSSFIGGLNRSRSKPGDKGFSASAKPIDPALQREALNLLISNWIKIDTFHLPEHVINNLNMGYHFDSERSDHSTMYRYRDHLWSPNPRHTLQCITGSIIRDLLSCEKVAQIIETQFMIKPLGKDYYSVNEHVSGISEAVFQEIFHKKNITDIRRDTQNITLSQMLSVWSSFWGKGITPTLSELELCFHKEIKKLKRNLQNILKSDKKKKLNEISIQHCERLLHCIQKAEERLPIQM